MGGVCVEEQGVRIKYRIVQFILLSIIIPGMLLFFYSSDYYHADASALQALSDSDEIRVITVRNDYTVFSPHDPEYELIFYPGGKVEYKAYAPLMHKLAENGVLCIMMNMPYNLAVLDPDAANRVIDLFPKMEHIYICGHSLGGYCASEYAANHSDKLEGLILLGAYSEKNLQNSGLNVLSVYGDRDKVLNKSKYDKCKCNLPENIREYIIEGGCHSYFGSYGLQSGDGEPALTREQQTGETAEIIIRHIQNPQSIRKPDDSDQL